LEQGTHRMILLAHELYYRSDYSMGISSYVDERTKRPNGMPLSRCERWESLPKNERSRARSGRLQRRVRHPGRVC
jgi:hypothetical protein